jgi:hypothetical protein
MLSPFEASDLKIARSRKHLQELQTEISSFFSTKPYRLVVEPSELNNQLGYIAHAWVVRINGSITAMVSTIIGDIFHNLRTALDLLACDLVRIAGESTKDVYFPFAKNAETLPGMIKSKNLNRAGPEVVKIIIDLKPYKDGNSLLRAIHDMNILDKHQALVPIIAGGASPAVRIAFNPSNPTTVPSIRTRISRDGQQLVTMPPVSNLPIGTELDAEWAMLFDVDAGPLGGCEIVETINQCASLTTGIIQFFRTRFPGPYTSFRPSRD